MGVLRERQGHQGAVLLHGHNGTGKSSLVESLELAITGKIERLDLAGESDYYKVIRHHPGQIPAAANTAGGSGAGTAECGVRIEVGREGRQTATIELTADNGISPSDALHRENFRAMSFRLDQQVMDRVVRASDVGRAMLLGESLLPELQKELEGFSGARGQAERAFRRLPAKIRDELSSDPEGREKQVLERFGWLAETDASEEKVPLERLELCLPLAEDTLQTLGTVSPGIRDLLARWKTKPVERQDVERELKTLEDYLNSALGSPTITEAFDTARAVLDQLKDWQGVRGRQTSRDFPTALNRWLESVALTDLAGRHHDVAACFSGLADGVWNWPQNVTPFPGVAELSSEQLAVLKEQQIELARRCEQQRSEVARWQKSNQAKVTKQARTRPGPPPRGPLSRSELEHLNLAGPYLTALRDGPSPRGLGDAVQQALTEHHEQEIGKLVIGRRGGAATALTELNALAAAYQNARSLSQEEAGWTGLHSRYLEAHQAFAASRQTGERLQRVFVDILAGRGTGSLPGLTAALNELLALFKPARWAYNDIALTPTSDAQGPQSGIGGLGRPPGLSGGATGLGLRTADGHRAELRLNTAELNSLTLALFLLTAVRTGNPLQVLVLDDPLQNMDELTVTALARGLAKLFRSSVFPAGWQLLALFHGEDDLERVRRETTCAVYHFPWLRPAARPDESSPLDIKESKERSNLVSRPQGIAGLFASQPAG